MAKFIVTVMLVVSICVLTGCESEDMGRSQVLPAAAKVGNTGGVVKPVTEREADLVEQMALSRQEYRKSLMRMSDYYEQTGDNMKLGWSKKELAAFDRMTQYSYIIEATVGGGEVRSLQSITAADVLYDDALAADDAARFLIIVDDAKLRLALTKYNDLIRLYPESDKVDDAAYRAADIYEHFKDYSIALLYYKRVFQWNPENEYPARYKAAYLLDRKFLLLNEAVTLYNEALEKEELSQNFAEFAQMRVVELTIEEDFSY